MLNARRSETDALITRYVNGVEKLKTTAEAVGGLQQEVEVKAVEVEEKIATRRRWCLSLRPRSQGW